MSELVQINKLLTLEDIAPNWARSISMGDYNYGELNSQKYCVVGEAHGYDSCYGCQECFRYSFAIYHSAYGYNNADKLKEDIRLNRDLTQHKQILANFVDHWNAVHVTDTAPSVR